MLLQDIERTIGSRRAHSAYIHGDEVLTYAELDRRAAEIANWLRRAGLQAGDRVAIRAQACVAYPATCVGIWRAGGVVVPLDPVLEEAELDYFLRLVQARYLADPRPATRPAPSARGRFEMRRLDPGERPESDPDTCPDDMLILFTSGTTGAPKGVVHTRASLDALVRRHVALSGLTSDDVILATSLFNTGFGFHSYISEPLLAGARVVIIHPFLPRPALNTASREAISCIPTVPAVLKLLTAVKPCPPLPALRKVRLSAATLDVASRDQFFTQFGIRPVQGYGMNEVGRIASTTRLRDAPSHSRIVGHPELEIKIFGDHGEPVASGELGEIGLRSPSLCRPFYLLGDGRREPLPRRGAYFLTGDLGRLSKDRVLELAGRRKAFILTPRYKVDPHEVEKVLVEHPSVADVAVIPVPGHGGYETVKAVVVVSAAVTGHELLGFCSERLPMGKCPQIVAFVDRVPRNALGKVEIAKLQAAS